MISGLDWRRGISDQVNREGHAPWNLQFRSIKIFWMILGCLDLEGKDEGNANDLRADCTKFWNSRQRDPAYFAEFDGLR